MSNKSFEAIENWWDKYVGGLLKVLLAIMSLLTYLFGVWVTNLVANGSLSNVISKGEFGVAIGIAGISGLISFGFLFLFERLIVQRPTNKELLEQIQQLQQSVNHLNATLTSQASNQDTSSNGESAKDNAPTKKRTSRSRKRQES